MVADTCSPTSVPPYHFDHIWRVYLQKQLQASLEMNKQTPVWLIVPEVHNKNTQIRKIK